MNGLLYNDRARQQQTFVSWPALTSGSPHASVIMGGESRVQVPGLEISSRGVRTIAP